MTKIHFADAVLAFKGGYSAGKGMGFLITVPMLWGCLDANTQYNMNGI
jgi:hypothetical protein